MKTPDKERKKAAKKQYIKQLRFRKCADDVLGALEARKERSKKASVMYSRSLLKGVRWEAFYGAANGNLEIEGVLFKLRVGFFFNIYCCAIICGDKYVVLRKVSTKSMPRRQRELVACKFQQSGWLGLMKDSDLRGEWFIAHSSNREGFCCQGANSFVLEKSKHEILRR